MGYTVTAVAVIGLAVEQCLPRVALQHIIVQDWTWPLFRLLSRICEYITVKSSCCDCTVHRLIWQLSNDGRHCDTTESQTGAGTLGNLDQGLATLKRVKLLDTLQQHCGIAVTVMGSNTLYFIAFGNKNISFLPLLYFCPSFKGKQ